MQKDQPSVAADVEAEPRPTVGLAVAESSKAETAASPGSATVDSPRLVATPVRGAVEAEPESPALERPAALIDRFASQGLFLFRYRSLFTVILLPAAGFAIYQQRRLGVAPDPGLAWFLAGLGCCLLGLTVRALTLGYVPGGTSGRDTRKPRAEVLNTTGMYSITRHPIYLGNVLMLLGYTVALRVWWFPLLAVLVYWLLFERIMAAEERYLARRFGAEFTRWAQRTPIFWPRFRSWRSPDLPFCWRSVLRREYNSVNLIATMLVFARFANQVLVGGMSPAHWAREDSWLLWSYAAVVAGFFVLRALRRHTRLLKPTGR
ncbi:MAG TPA: isoprenylcysteine carboxylmethyltransferase family protein [Thermoanaerobaculia bacterium]|nr:isoprenylcysteine carboxylmethyltransferase family protein [Thermoanaerobaculia bacterium]